MKKRDGTAKHWAKLVAGTRNACQSVTVINFIYYCIAFNDQQVMSDFPQKKTINIVNNKQPDKNFKFERKT